MAKHTFIKRVECPSCKQTFDTDFEVDGIPDDLVVTRMHSSIRVKDPEKAIKQNMITDSTKKVEYVKGKFKGNKNA